MIQSLMFGLCLSVSDFLAESLRSFTLQYSFTQNTSLALQNDSLSIVKSVLLQHSQKPNFLVLEKTFAFHHF